MTQLLITIELWTELLDTGAPLDVIYLDFKKAFDSVPHKRLLYKLDAYGIGDPIKEWIKNFLVNRKQRVTVNRIMSSWSEVLSVIPYSSVLGPVLFVIFINDLPDAVTSTTKIFADDTKLFRAIRGPEDREKLQDDLNQLVKWSEKWQLGFNENKCKVLHLGNSNQKQIYEMNGTTLDITHAKEDLGVTVVEDLKFHKHISNA